VQEGLLARSWSAGAEVHAANVGVILQDDPDDPMRMAIRQILRVIAQLDRSMLTKRMMDGRRRKKADGGKGEGQYRFGFTKDGPNRRTRYTAPDRRADRPRWPVIRGRRDDPQQRRSPHPVWPRMVAAESRQGVLDCGD